MNTEEWQFMPDIGKSQPIQVLNYRLMAAPSSDSAGILRLVILALRGDEFLKDNTPGLLVRPNIPGRPRLNTRLLRKSELRDNQYEIFFKVKTLSELPAFIPEAKEVRQLLKW